MNHPRACATPPACACDRLSERGCAQCQAQSRLVVEVLDRVVSLLQSIAAGATHFGPVKCAHCVRATPPCASALTAPTSYSQPTKSGLRLIPPYVMPPAQLLSPALRPAPQRAAQRPRTSPAPPTSSAPTPPPTKPAASAAAIPPSAAAAGAGATSLSLSPPSLALLAMVRASADKRPSEAKSKPAPTTASSAAKTVSPHVHVPSLSLSSSRSTHMRVKGQPTLPLPPPPAVTKPASLPRPSDRLSARPHSVTVEDAGSSSESEARSGSDDDWPSLTFWHDHSPSDTRPRPLTPHPDRALKPPPLTTTQLAPVASAFQSGGQAKGKGKSGKKKSKKKKK